MLKYVASLVSNILRSFHICILTDELLRSDVNSLATVNVSDIIMDIISIVRTLLYIVYKQV